MTLNIEELQELPVTDPAELAGCPVLWSCCPITLPGFFTVVSCFGCTFTS